MKHRVHYNYIAISVAFPNPEAMALDDIGINNNKTPFIDVFLHANIM